MKNWTTNDIPSQKGRCAIVTGGTEGLGFAIAEALVGAGCDVIVASRNAARGDTAVANIRARFPEAHIRFEMLDLGSLDDIGRFVRKMIAKQPELHVLINNAGVMTPPKRLTTSDGFEVQIGVNFLGHFALTSGLLPLLRAATDPRVVTMSSLANRGGDIHVDDLQAERKYRPMRAYAQSKLANLIFAFELQRRSETERWGISSLAAHPGLAKTDLYVSGPGMSGPMGLFGRLAGPILFQSAADGALPALFAATSPEAEGGAYYGPKGLKEIRGGVAPATIAPLTKDAELVTQLWKIAEDLTHVSYP